MRVIIKKTMLLQGLTSPPPSKSEAVRSLIFALLSNGLSHIHPLLPSDDIQDALAACQAMGAQITNDGAHAYHINSQGVPFSAVASHIHTGNSGITTRFLLPLLGYRSNPQVPVILDCGDQMKARPMGSLLAALRTLGMKIECLGLPDTLPVSVTGTLLGGETEISGITSQYLSALLIALPLAPNNSEIQVRNLLERPYVDLTLAWLTRQSIKFEHEQKGDLDIFYIPGNQQYYPFDIELPGDFSNASYLLAAGVLTPGEIKITGLDLASKQGDKKLIDLMIDMGANITVINHDVIVRGDKALRGIKIDANEIPDLLPTLAVLGTIAQGQTEIYNVPQARLKETDRIHSMTEGLTRMGGNIVEKPDGMIIYPSKLSGASVKGYGDHRTVMALSLAGLIADGETVIDEAESINKTFPDYFDSMKKLGANIEVRHD